MTILDYLLIAAFAVGSVYTVCRLFLGWRNSSSHHIDSDNVENAKVTGSPAAHTFGTAVNEQMKRVHHEKPSNHY